MRQLLYVSSNSPSLALSVGDILMTSRRRNDADGVSGLLYTEGNRFLQVMEGKIEVVNATFGRIRADPRHRAIVLLSDRRIVKREFGNWAMAHRVPGDTADDADARLSRLLANASAEVHGMFTRLVAGRCSFRSSWISLLQ